MVILVLFLCNYLSTSSDISSDDHLIPSWQTNQKKFTNQIYFFPTIELVFKSGGGGRGGDLLTFIMGVITDVHLIWGLKFWKDERVWGLRF